MKKKIYMLLTAQVVSMSLLAGCGGTAPAQTAEETAETAVAVEETAAEEPTVVEETTTAEETETETETTEPAPLPYVEEQGLAFSKETSYTIGGIRYDQDNTSDYEMIDADVEIISAAQEPAEQEGYRTVTVKYSASGEAWADLEGRIYGLVYPDFVICDIYTGRVIPSADTKGDMSVEYSTELEWEGQTYTVGYTEDVQWEQGDWEEREDGYYLKMTLYNTHIITIPDDYDGLALMMSPTTEYDDSEAGVFDEEESYIMDEWEDGSRLFLVSDLLEALGE